MIKLLSSVTNFVTPATPDYHLLSSVTTCYQDISNWI